jgi:hypothetical protein
MAAECESLLAKGADHEALVSFLRERYTKRVLALLELEDNGPIAYTIVVYADLKDKAKADDLLAQVIAGFEIER